MQVAKTAKPLVSDFAVIINGSPLSTEAKSHVAAVQVEVDTNLPGMFALTLFGSDFQKSENGWSDDQKLFAIGSVVEIKLGYVDDLQTLIVGEITALEPEFFSSRLPSLTIRGYDRRHRLHRGRKTRTFVQQKDSDIAAQIAKESGLSPQAEDSGVVHDYVLQPNQTDMEFLQARARRIHYEIGVEDKTLFFRPVANAESEMLTLTLGNDLLEFCPRLSSAGQVSEVTVRGWNPKEKKEILGQAKTGDEVSTMGGEKSGAALSEDAFGAAAGTVSDRPVMTQAEADQLAKARFNDLALELVFGEGLCHGRTDLMAGKVIKIDGVGKRFGGQYYVTAAAHRYTCRSAYRTHFIFRRNAS